MRRLTRVLPPTLLAAGLVLAPAAPAQAEDTACSDTPPDEVELAESRGPLPDLLHLDAAHRVATGRGVGVAVVDTGVSPGAPGAGRVDVRVSETVPGVTGRVVDTHGTLVAGLVAGRSEDGDALGVAPDAHVVSIKVADARQGLGDVVNAEDVVTLSSAWVAAGVRRAIALREAHRIGVINLSLNFDEPDPALASAIRDAIARGIVVVASVGNRPEPEGEEPDPETAYEVGEDTVRFPATLPGVIAVTGLGADGTLDPSLVWTGPDVDVSAPVRDVVTVNVGGTTCLIQTSGSSWAAAQVSGLAALVIEEFGPGLTPAQVATRIRATARGALRDSALDGHGMIQPREAVTALLDIAPNGRLDRAAAYDPPAPRIDPPAVAGNPFANLRAGVLWWGMGAGSLLLACLILRPLVARRR